jgi:hypothetical protein
MQWFRVRARIVAAVTLVSLTALGGLSSAAHGPDCHDDDCYIALIAHDPSSHGIGTTTADGGHPLHCILCHWTRTLRPSTDAVHQIARPVTSDIRPQPDIPAALSPVQAAQPPLRSPPPLLALTV